MSEPTLSGNPGRPGNLPWLDRLTMSVPGYGGYVSQKSRRAAAFALRDAILRRLTGMREGLETAKKSCENLNVHTGVASLNRVEEHLELIIERVQGLGTRVEDFYESPDFENERLAPIYGADLALLNQTDKLLRHFEHPEATHNMLADLEGDLREFEAMLDGRALMLRGLQGQTPKR